MNDDIHFNHVVRLLKILKMTQLLKFYISLHRLAFTDAIYIVSGHNILQEQICFIFL